MGRPLTGSLRAHGRSWVVEVPVARGSRARVSRAFNQKADAEAWRAAAVTALTTGDPLPEADAFRTADPAIFAATRGKSATFEDVAADWHRERFGTLRRAQPQRAADVLRKIDRHILPFLRAHGVATGSDLTRGTYVDLLVGLADPSNRPRHARAAEAGGMDPLTVAAASAATGASRSTLRRRLADRSFPNAAKDPHGQWLIPWADLDAAGLTSGPLSRGPRPRGGLSQDVLADVRRTLDAILRHGVATAGWILTFEPASVDNPVSRALPRPPRRQITVDETVTLAGHLHAVHQIALWQMRVLGLRISEAYGLRVCDVVDFGDRGMVVVHAQGGRLFLVEDGEGVAATDRKDQLKTRQSRRLLIVPTPLMALLRTTIDVFHTDPDTGAVDLEARLIPRLTASGRDSQAAFRAALRAAALAAGLDVNIQDGESLLPRPHDLRAANLTDLAWTHDLEELIRKRWAGHIAGRDVHHAHYVLDHPDAQTMLPVVQRVEELLRAASPGGHMVPTHRRCTTKSQPALYDRRGHIDEALQELGWLVAPDAASEAMTAAQAAAILAVGTHTVRRMAQRGDLNALPGHDLLLVSTDSVLAVVHQRAVQVRTTDLATELEVPPERLRRWIQRHALPVDRDGTDWTLPDTTVAFLRDLVMLERRLRANGVRLSQAAVLLGVDAATIHRLIHHGTLSVLPESGPDGGRYVSRESLDLFEARRGARGRRRSRQSLSNAV